MTHKRRGVRSSRLTMISGWVLVALSLAGYLVNEFTADIPLLHYSFLGVMFAGGWLGLRHLR